MPPGTPLEQHCPRSFQPIAPVLSALGHKWTFVEGLAGTFSDECRSARQDNPDLSELTRLRIDLDGARVLFHDDIVTDRKAKARALSRRLGREKRVEHLFFHVRRHTGAVVVNSDFHAIAKVFGRGRESRLVVATISLCSAPGRSIEAVCNEIKKARRMSCGKTSAPPADGSKDCLSLTSKPCVSARAPCREKGFLNESIDINHPMLTRAFARVLQHILDDSIRASAMMHDLIEIALQRVGQFVDFSSGFIVEWHTL